MFRVIVLAAVLAGLSGSALVRAAEPAWLCRRAVAAAAADTGVPEAVLLSVALTETGRGDRNGQIQPWPWALNLAGKAHFFPDRAGAFVALEQAIAAGRRNIDIGCLQVNFRWHAQGFSGLEDMLDPDRNARYAAKFLADLYQSHGQDWAAAVAAYHSQDPVAAQRYLARYQPIFAQVSAGSRQDPPVPEHENGYPLLQLAAAGALGSLVPVVAPRRTLLGPG